MASTADINAKSSQEMIKKPPPKEEVKPKKRRKAKVIVFPRREPSVVIPPRPIIYPTPDKTTCAVCKCYPKEEPFIRPKKLRQCQVTPLTLYELAAEMVDSLYYPICKYWPVERVAEWMADTVGLPQYMDCIRDNKIDGARLLRLEDPSMLPKINIHDFEHIKRITAQIRKDYQTDYILFSRSVGLPPRYPLTHCTLFKCRTGPNYGIRQNWSRCDILRWMKILDPAPIHWNHWDLVWYLRPDFPWPRFAKVPGHISSEIPHYVKEPDICNEYLAKRKFIIMQDIPDELQYIWMERKYYPPSNIDEKMRKMDEEKQIRKGTAKKKATVQMKIRPTLLPKRVPLEGLSGNDLILARRLMPKKRFLA